MTTIKPWMRNVLRGVALLSLVSGIAIALLRHELFDLANLDHPEVPFPLQATGALIALLGVGVGLAARRPLEHRALVAISCAANALLVCAMTYNVVKGKLPPYCCLVAVVQFVLFLLLGIIARELYRVRSPWQEAESDTASRAVRWMTGLSGWRVLDDLVRRRGWTALVAVLLLLTIASTIPGIEQTHRWWTTPARLRLTPVAAKLPISAGPITTYRTVDAFPNLRFDDPVFITPLDGQTGRLLVAERPGRIFVFDNSSASNSKTLFLDITDRVIDVRGSGEDGLSGIALHPQFADSASPHCGEFFLHYTARIEGRRSIRISKFSLPAGKEVADPNSEVVLIDQPDENISHNGGSILFGPDGFLYVTIGDDDQRHPNPYAQFIDRDLFSGVLRIDVDCRGGEVSHPIPRQPHTGTTAHYYIPNDNPFVGHPDALEEFYAIGLRNPWRASFDRQTGKYWVTDVGERLREEINIVENGSNCGWAYVEGSVESKSHEPLALGRPDPYLGTETWPLYEYERDALNRCIIGGYVYRGKEFPELVGKYIYADTSGRIYALETDDAGKFVDNSLIAVVEDGGHGPVSFGEDANGELLICIIKQLNYQTGEIHRLVRTEIAPDQQMPDKLSGTRLFADLRALKPATYLVPFEVNTPLWSDRAAKQRWIALPKGQKITGNWSERWRFPTGTVTVKHFDLPLDERDPKNPATLRRLETRVLICDDQGGVFGAAYRWNDDLTDASIVDFPQTEVIDYVDAQGTPRKQTWYYPGRFECLTCHNPQTDLVLAFNARQLNRDVMIDGLRENQLVRFARAGMFENPWTEAQLESLPHLAPIDDPQASIEHRVRSYLDANCAHCHRPHVYTGTWDARFQTPLELQRIIGNVAMFHQINDPQARVVRPGDLEHSYMYKRISSNVSYMKMPPIGRNVIDDQAAALIGQWIQSLPPTPDLPPTDLAEKPAQIRVGRKP